MPVGSRRTRAARARRETPSACQQLLSLRARRRIPLAPRGSVSYAATDAAPALPAPRELSGAGDARAGGDAAPGAVVREGPGGGDVRSAGAASDRDGRGLR